MGTGTKIALGLIGAIVLIVIIFGTAIAGTYNSLVTLDQAAQAQWGQVENAYQRRTDLIPEHREHGEGRSQLRTIDIDGCD